MKYPTVKEVKENKVLSQLIHDEKIKDEKDFSFIKLYDDDYSNILSILKSAKFEYLHKFFPDPNLIDKLYACPLQDKEITLYDLIDSVLITQLCRAFQDPITGKFPFPQRFHFESKGPYQVDKISYMTSESSRVFKEKNKTLKSWGYYAIDLPRKWSVAFIYNSLFLIHFSVFPALREKLKEFFKIYFLTLPNSSSLRKKLSNEEVEKFFKNPKEITYAELQELILLSEPELAEFIKLPSPFDKDWHELTIPQQQIKRERDSITFLTNLMTVNEQIPSLEISPAFKSTDPSSPILSFIHLSIPSLIQLQETIHGTDTCYPLFCISSPSLYLFSKTAAEPEKFGFSNCRPVQIFSSNLTSAEKYHGQYALDYFASWHDLVLHGFRNGANPYKPIQASLIIFVQKLKGYPMTSWMWSLSDMDTSLGRIFREYLISANPVDLLKIHCQCLNMLFELLSRRNGFSLPSQFLEHGDKHDTNIAVMIHLYQNQMKFRTVLNDFLIEYLFSDENIYKEILLGEDYSKMINFFNKVKKIVDSDRNQSIEYYILEYRLIDYPQACAILKGFNLKKILKWERNQGLFFVDSGPKKYLEEMKPVEVFKKIINLLSQLPDYNADVDKIKLIKLKRSIDFKNIKENFRILATNLIYESRGLSPIPVPNLSPLESPPGRGKNKYAFLSSYDLETIQKKPGKQSKESKALPKSKSFTY